MLKRKEAENINGRYVYCPHYQGTLVDAYRPDTIFRCKKHGERVTCLGCSTCPKCGGMIICESSTISHGMHNSIIHRDMKCLICGLYTQEQVQVEKPKNEQKKKAIVGKGQIPAECSVKGCKQRTWEGHTIDIETDNGTQTFRVCETHRRRMKTWRAHNGKGIDQIPVIYFLGELIDNPDYKYKTRGH